MKKEQMQQMLEILAENEMDGQDTYEQVVDYVRQYKEHFGEDGYIIDYVFEYMQGRLY